MIATTWVPTHVAFPCRALSSKTFQNISAHEPNTGLGRKSWDIHRIQMFNFPRIMACSHLSVTFARHFTISLSMTFERDIQTVWLFRLEGDWKILSKKFAFRNYCFKIKCVVVKFIRQHVLSALTTFYFSNSNFFSK